MSDSATRQSWDTFREVGLLWFVNRLLHLFGWAIVVQVNAAGDVMDAYPARVTFRGFGEADEREGFIGLTEYLHTNSHALLDDMKNGDSHKESAA